MDERILKWIYDLNGNISDENIWSIVINHIPKLREEINDLIKSSDS